MEKEEKHCGIIINLNRIVKDSSEYWQHAPLTAHNTLYIVLLLCTLYVAVQHFKLPREYSSNF